ncbi:hypothetical protein L873DRAFT_1080266 [Choiromyces venosus 120613-1]|uniref:Uncharacterized protein n=1 Tax=Choiromyces venosus 120613-1 TaxID=1336337 RepID=A0A3N4JI52_9PEZI|nr:hypothetical protein L873DRAFT_1080266 [Choiromyces venosus 120613-1]
MPMYCVCSNVVVLLAAWSPRYRLSKSWSVWIAMTNPATIIIMVGCMKNVVSTELRNDGGQPLRYRICSSNGRTGELVKYHKEVCTPITERKIDQNLKPSSSCAYTYHTLSPNKFRQNICQRARLTAYHTVSSTTKRKTCKPPSSSSSSWDSKNSETWS